MTCRYAHKRVATLLAAVQTAPAERVVEWPQPSIRSSSARTKSANAGKSQPKNAHANK